MVRSCCLGISMNTQGSMGLCWTIILSPSWSASTDMSFTPKLIFALVGIASSQDAGRMDRVLHHFALFQGKGSYCSERDMFLPLLVFCIQVQWSLIVQTGGMRPQGTSSTFLNGVPAPRQLYFRQPRGGVRGLQPGQLVEVVKGVFGLSTSPKLWWMKLSQELCSLEVPTACRHSILLAIQLALCRKWHISVGDIRVLDGGHRREAWTESPLRPRRQQSHSYIPAKLGSSAGSHIGWTA